MITTSKALGLLALLFAILSLVIVGYPLLTTAVVLLAIERLV